MSDHLMQEMFVAYNKSLATAMQDKKRVGDAERRDAMRAALKVLAKNVTLEMEEAAWADAKNLHENRDIGVVISAGILEAAR